MLEVVKSNLKIDFCSKFKFTGPLSIILVVGSLLLVLRGLNYGVDFRGGAEVLVSMETEVSLDDLRSTLKNNGFAGASVQTFAAEGNGFQYLAKVPANEENLNDVAQKIGGLLTDKFSENMARVDKVDIVGPKAGAQLRTSGFQAMLWALVAIMIYIALRFDFKYSPGAIAALFHDVVIILGVFAVMELEFTLQIVAALLAIIGYSVNDTVVIYDRVREHEQKYVGKTLAEQINNAVSETLSRTVLTSGTTLFISLAMFFFAGQSIKDFFFAISLGVIIGTYSSIFVAAPVTLIFDKFQQTKKQQKANA